MDASVTFFPELFYLVLLSFLVVASFVALDDIVIDFIALIKNLRPQEITKDDLKSLRKLSQKNIAIVVANWQEAEVLERMVRGNLSRIEYAKLWFFIGVYPNDIETVNAALRVARSDSRVIVVENPSPGPTTKGQMLNIIFHRVFETETRLDQKFDLFLMHDSEDVIHPQALLLINAESEKADFIQIPVFSFKRELSQVVASTYVDEFSEIHTKDLIVRDWLQAGVPSAGVGTALSRKLVLALMKRQNGQLLMEGSLTEDYILGLTASELGYSTHFISRYIGVYDQKGKLVSRNFIATKEYFPSTWARAIRQKARWIHGIVFQGSRVLSFSGSLARRYFLLHDRKGPITAIVGLLGMVFLGANLAVKQIAPDFYYSEIVSIMARPLISALLVINLAAGVIRMIQRVRAVALTHDLTTGLFSILRIPIGNIINFASTVRAIRQDRQATKIGEAPRWVKTVHELPPDFGLPETIQTTVVSPPTDQFKIDKEKQVNL